MNITYDATRGPGFIRTWGTRSARSTTSSTNADEPNAVVANSAIVPLDADGTFVLESSTTGRVVIDVTAWLIGTNGSTDDGRFIALPPSRLADTRLPAGVPLDSGSTNQWERVGNRIDVGVTGSVGVPDDGTVSAVVVSIAAISGGGPGGWVGAYPGGGIWAGTSNVNVLPGDVRANTVVVALDGADYFSMRTLNIADVAVDVVGYVTSNAALDVRVRTVRRDRSGPRRRYPHPGRVPAPRSPDCLDRRAAGRGGERRGRTERDRHPARWSRLGSGPSRSGDPGVSNVNYTAAGQTRAALAFTRLTEGGRVRFTSLVRTDLVVDVVGFFSE